jgi:hypothetical protein
MAITVHGAPQNQRQTFAQKLNTGVGRGLDMASQMQAASQQKEAIRKAFGDEVANLPPELQKIYISESLKGQRPLNPLQQAKLDALEGQQKLFKQLYNKQGQENIPGMDQFQENEQIQSQDQNPLSSAPKNLLHQVANFAGQPGPEGIIGNMAKSELERQEKENKQRTDKEKQYFKFNEPKLAQLADTERKLELESARYDRLGELFSDSSKFPSSLTAALFSKDGQINDLVYSQLTPEAQEAIKLIIDSTSNIKDTYGARVTNFDLQTYLKKLPSLLNSPEGKMRVLRDLQIMNQLNQLHAQGIQEIFDEKGGSDKIPFSTAEKLYKDRYGAMERQMLDKFIHAEKGKFNEMPDPDKYLGRKIRNPETGEVFISDGQEWKPFKG